MFLLSAEMDAINRSISGLESQMGELQSQKAQVERYLQELEEARRAVGNGRTAFFDQLSTQRKRIALVGNVANAAVARGMHARLSEAFGASFESGVDQSFLGLIGDVDFNIQAAQNKLNDLDVQLRSTQRKADQARDDLRAQAAKEEAARTAEERGK